MTDKSKKSRTANGRSSIYEGADGYWHGRVTVGTRDDGKPDRRHTRSKDKQKVVDKVKEWEIARDNGSVRKAGDRWSVEKWLRHWVENIAAPAVRPNTLTGYRAAVYNHLIPGVGKHRLDKLRPEHLEAMYAAIGRTKTRRGELFKPARIHQIHRTMRTALGEAQLRRHITENPAAIAKPPRVPREEIVPFTQEEAGKILTAAKTTSNGARFVIALTLGLRKGEALGLQWRDVDLDGRTLSVRRALHRRNWEHGCSDKSPCGRRYAGHCPSKHSGGTVVAEVKSEAGHRTMGLPLPVVKVLREHRAAQARARALAADMWTEGGWVFTNALGHPVHPKVDHMAWKALLGAAKVRDARLHDARHTAATMLLALGVPTTAVMTVMGWSQAAMAKRYQHNTPEITRAIADKVGGLLWAEEGDDDGPTGVPIPA
ncbi:tyrosine-type recombinase/integrase [Actinokineospora sp.]|uniref:tyrosine-type recombinase/integrase n=1 Tax=Actinokineospora sp. TaxID=1872133 RepID=UPI003D6A7C8D